MIIEAIKAAFDEPNLKVTFSEGFSLKEYREQVARQQPDIAIVDLNLPDGKGTQILHAPLGDNPFPVLIMTGQGDQQSAVEAIKSGALDYIVKSGEAIAAMPHHVERALREWKSLQMQKWMSETLKSSQSFMKTVLNTIHGGVVVMERRTGKVMDANRYALDLIGAPKEKIIGAPARGLFLAGDEAECPQSPGCASENRESTVIKADGTVVPVLMTLVPVALNGQECVLGHFVDITERKRGEAKAAQAQKLEVVGRMASGVAHDYNNLLTLILGNCSFLLEELTPGDRKREEVYSIKRAAEQGASLVRQLLAFSRKQVMQPKVLELNGVLSAMEKLLQTVVGKKNALLFRLDEGLPSIKADASQLEQVVLNLALNARDAMPSGGTLVLETGLARSAVAGELPPGDHVLLKVTDSGTGMDPAVLSRIFEPFFTTKEEGKGTGLGLATVQDIVSKSGGQIRVKSAPGEGTSFTIFLPAIPAAPEERPQAEAVSPRTVPATASVLLVEDDEDLRQLTARILTAAGYRVTAAANAKEALTRILDSFDLLLLDVFLPDISGVALAEKLTAGGKPSRVLFTSAFIEKPETREIFSDPKNLFLPKPFTREALLEKVGEALRSGKDGG